MNKKIFIFFFFIFSIHLIETKQQQQQKAPFFKPDTIHYVKSQFQFNLILNENRNLQIAFAQFSRQNSKNFLHNLFQGAFQKQSNIALGILIDCRDFTYDLNQTLGLCMGFDQEKAKQQQALQSQLPDDKKIDKFFRFQFMSPNPSKIKQKGHILSKNHDVQNLGESNYKFNQEFLAKIIKNQIPDFVTYIQDNYDMEQFLQTKSQFSFSKKAKILFFDSNLQSPLFLKKLAARFDGQIKIGVTDNYKLAKKYNIFIDSILLMEYNFDTQTYQSKKIDFNQGNEITSILQNQSIQRYLNLQRYRDIILDFQHREPQIYNMSSLTQINQLMTYGRLIYLEISKNQNKYECQNIKVISQKYDTFFNYICFSKKNIEILKKAGLKIQNMKNQIFIINKSFKNSTRILYNPQNFNAYELLPGLSARQKVSVSSQAQICLKTAFASKKDPVIYWYNEKQHKNTLKLLQYFNNLPEINSLIYFCQIYLPNEQIKKDYQLQQNCLFSMKSMGIRGQMQKFQFRQALQFAPIKMFLRELAINQMTKVYEQKLSFNSLKQIKSAEDLTKQCFSKDCIIALLATNKFRQQSQFQILKQIKLEIHDQGYNFVWIDGYCHWDIAKQLKIINLKQKFIDRSFIFYYKEKSNSYSLMNSNKYWVKKDVKKWIKTLKDLNTIKRLKFGIDIEDKKCQIIQKSQEKQTLKTKNNKKNTKNKVNENQL